MWVHVKGLQVILVILKTHTQLVILLLSPLSLSFSLSSFLPSVLNWLIQVGMKFLRGIPGIIELILGTIDGTNRGRKCVAKSKG